MEKLGNMNLYSLEEINDEVFGKIGTPERDAMENQLKEELEAYHIGETIRNARKAQNLTQEQFGERIGVQKSQISKIERGKNITFTSMSRIFKALGVTTASLDLGKLGKVVLW